MTKEKIQKRLDELNKKLWLRAQVLSCRCTPYDMDEKYQKLLTEERELLEKLKCEN